VVCDVCFVCVCVCVVCVYGLCVWFVCAWLVSMWFISVWFVCVYGLSTLHLWCVLCTWYLCSRALRQSVYVSVCVFASFGVSLVVMLSSEQGRVHLFPLTSLCGNAFNIHALLFVFLMSLR